MNTYGQNKLLITIMLYELAVGLFEWVALQFPEARVSRLDSKEDGERL